MAGGFNSSLIRVLTRFFRQIIKTLSTGSHVEYVPPNNPLNKNKPKNPIQETKKVELQQCGARLSIKLMPMTEKNEKIRLSVTMTKPYTKALDNLVEKGLYLSRGEAILELLRHFLKRKGIEPFSFEIEDSPE